MKKYVKTSCMIATLLLSACSIQDLVDKTKSAVEDAVVQAALDQATQAGGKAVLVNPAQETSIKIEQADSPIAGAEVRLPAGAVRGTDGRVVLTLTPAGDTAPITDDTLTVAGPVLAIELQALDGGTPTLSTAATVFLPYGDKVSAENIDTLLAAHQKKDGKVSFLAKQTTDTAGTRISGETDSFSLFFPVLVAPALSLYPGPCTIGRAGATFEVEYSYNASGQLTKKASHDTTNPSAYWAVETYAYDTQGRMVEKSQDNNGDGTINNVITVTYNGDGTVKNETDSGNYSRDYVYDTHGNVTKFTENWDTNGPYVTNYTNTYDANNNLSGYLKVDSNGNKERFTFTYDANGNKIKSERDVADDGSIQNTETWTYDAAGNILTHNAGDDNDVYDYSCWQ